MKTLICAILTLASLSSLSACSGQSPTTSSYPMAQNNAAMTGGTQTGLQDPNQPAGQIMDQLAQPESPALPRHSVGAAQIPGTRSTSAIFDKLAHASQVSSPAKPVSSKPAAPRASSAAVKPVAQAPSQAATQAAAADELVAKAVERFDSLESFKINVEGFETLVGKSPSRLSFNMFALNGQAKIEVLKHSNSLYVGVKMGYQSGSDAISVRPGGMLGFVKVDTKMNDERLSTPRGYRLDQIDAFAITERLLKGPNHPKVLGKTQINGRNVAVLEYTKANDFDSRVTRELLGIDMEDHFIRMHEMYEGTTLVFSLKLSNIQLNAPVSVADLSI